MELTKIFTRQEAESALPLVKQIVGDILATAAAIRARPEDDDELPRLQADLEEALGELSAMGCFYKDGSFEVGLVDFPAIIEGETVFLCWRSDEDTLSWYHPIDEGFSGRRPLPLS
jgi:hypothetical protein